MRVDLIMNGVADISVTQQIVHGNYRKNSIGELYQMNGIILQKTQEAMQDGLSVEDIYQLFSNELDNE